MTDAVRAKGNPNDKLRVEATKLGYYGMRRRRPGDIFEVKRRLFSAAWMAERDRNTPLRQQTAADVIAQRDAAIRAGKFPEQLGPNAADPLDESQTEEREEVEI